MQEPEIYLNHAGTSWPKPRPVVAAVEEAMSGSPSGWGERFEAAHRALAEFFGIGDPGQLLLTPGCTSSLATAIADIDLGERNRVLSSVWEHHAVHRPLLKLAQSGGCIEYTPASNESALDLNRLESQLKQGDVGLVAITMSANVTGDLLPYQAVVELAHQYNAQVLLDAAQLVGWIDLDFDTLGADLIAFGGHKGLHGPWGIGGLYIADSARMNSSPVNPESLASEWQARPGYCDVGSVDQVALAGLYAAVSWLKKIDRVARINAARQLIAELELALGEVGARCFSINDANARMPTVAFSVHGHHSEALAASLRTRGLIVGSGLQCAGLAHQTLGTASDGLVRASVGMAQAGAEIQMAITRIRQAL